MANEIEKARNHILKLRDTGIISKTNYELIIDFTDKLIAEGHKKGPYSDNRIKKYIYGLITMSKIIKKDFNKVKKNDINQLAKNIREKYNGETPRDYLVMLRLFMKFIKELDGEEFDENEFPDIVKKIKPGARQFPKIKKSQLLTMEEIKQLANNTDNLRDRAFILTLYETGCRIGELLGDDNYPGIKIGDVIDNFDKYGAAIDVDGKTGIRNLRVISSAPAISNWLQEHPDRDNKEAPLFCGIWTNRGGKIRYRYWNKLLKKTGKKIDLNKKLNPHWFRHSRATELARFMTEFQLCKYMGWQQGSKQARTYVNLSGKDTEDTILKMYGLKKEDEEKSKFTTIECLRCKTFNDPASRFCSHCSLGLDDKTMMEYDQQKEEATKHGMLLQQHMDKDELEKLIGDILLKKLQQFEQQK